MTLRVVPGYRRFYRSNIGRVSVNIGKVPRGKEIVSEVIGMVLERKEIVLEIIGMVSRVSGGHRNGSGKVGIVPGQYILLFVN